MAAEDRGALLVLGSDAPTVEAFHRAREGGYLIPLPRTGTQRPAEIVDDRGERGLIARRIVTIGLLDQSQVHPREVFADVIADRARGARPRLRPAPRVRLVPRLPPLRLCPPLRAMRDRADLPSEGGAACLPLLRRRPPAAEGLPRMRRPGDGAARGGRRGGRGRAPDVFSLGQDRGLRQRPRPDPRRPGESRGVVGGGRDRRPGGDRDAGPPGPSRGGVRGRPEPRGPTGPSGFPFGPAHVPLDLAHDGPRRGGRGGPRPDLGPGPPCRPRGGPPGLRSVLRR